jgi:hypothetical protein
MGTEGSRRVQMGPEEPEFSYRVRMGLGGPVGFLMGSDGSIWAGWVWMVPGGSGWVVMGHNGYEGSLWVLTDKLFNGVSRFAMIASDGFRRVLIGY